jgi:hypothetical protein
MTKLIVAFRKKCWFTFGALCLKSTSCHQDVTRQSQFDTHWCRTSRQVVTACHCSGCWSLLRHLPPCGHNFDHTAVFFLWQIRKKNRRVGWTLDHRQGGGLRRKKLRDWQVVWCSATVLMDYDLRLIRFGFRQQHVCFLLVIMRTCFLTFSEATELSPALLLFHLRISVSFKSGQSICQLSSDLPQKRLTSFWYNGSNSDCLVYARQFAFCLVTCCIFRV